MLRTKTFILIQFFACSTINILVVNLVVKELFKSVGAANSLKQCCIGNKKDQC